MAEKEHTNTERHEMEHLQGKVSTGPYFYFYYYNYICTYKYV